MTGIVDRLERAGLVERHPAQHDRRVTQLALTRSGQAVKRQAAAICNTPPSGIARLSDEDLNKLGEILGRALR